MKEMKLKLTKDELEKLEYNADAIRFNLVSRALYNESLKYDFTDEDLKRIWFAEQNLVLELYMRKKVEPRVMVNETTVLDEYNANKDYFVQNNIPLAQAREIIRNKLTEEVNAGLFEDLVKKIMNDMDETITLSKEDVLFTKGDTELIKAILLITALKENAKKDNFFEENKETIEILGKDARMNYYINTLLEKEAIVTNETVLNEVQRISKENFNQVKDYSQEQLFQMVGNELLAQKVEEEKAKMFERVLKEYDIEKIVEGYVKK